MFSKLQAREEINSLLGATGYAISEVIMNSEIKVLEEDKYGRKLFLYFENKVVSTYSLLISQKSDDEYVYFYPDDNFISLSREELHTFDEQAKPENSFSEEAISILKRKNHWDMEMDTEHCMKYKITRKKEEGPVLKRLQKQLYEKALGEDAYNYKYSMDYFISDRYNRSIYLARGKASSKRYLVMLFQSNDSYDESTYLMELKDLQNYQEELRAFKSLNNWNMSKSFDD